MKFLNKFNTFILTLLAINFKPDVILAADASAGPTSLDMIFSPVGIFCILIFILAYGFVMAEEFTHFRKSKPVILAATIIWVVIAYVASQDPSISPKWAETQFRHVVLEFAELFFFLFVAMAYVNSLTERRMFDALCSWLSNNNFSYKKIFVISGVIAFFLSPIADNLTTALILGTVVMVAGRGNKAFIVPGLINIVVAANAGGGNVGLFHFSISLIFSFRQLLIMLSLLLLCTLQFLMKFQRVMVKKFKSYLVVKLLLF